ncbi:MAG: hypothetical protein MI743_17115 [Sneathiellales bacterium]|nr:hypothetical protein [Sneathiellales bacterium]
MRFKVKHIIAAAGIMAGSIFSTSASADTLDFYGDLGLGFYGSGPLTLSNATITTTLPILHITPPNNNGATNGASSIAAVFTNPAGANRPGNEMVIDFHTPITNLSFDGFVGSLISATDVTAFNGTDIVGTDFLGIYHKTVDFTGIAQITSLVFSDPSSGHEGHYLNDFNFETVAISAVPLPAAFPLFAAALAGMGLMGWKRKKHNI